MPQFNYKHYGQNLRIRAYNNRGEAMLIISEVFPQDYGTYACIGTKHPGPNNYGATKNVYQFVEFKL